MPQAIRSACPTPIKEVSPQVISNAPQFTPFITSNEQRIHAKRSNRCDSSESDETDPNCFRQESKDDEFLVPGNAGFHYGSVPYQHGGSSGRRYSSNFYLSHFHSFNFYNSYLSQFNFN